MIVVVFLLAVPVITLALAQTGLDLARLRRWAFLLLLMLCALFSPDAQVMAIICAAAILEFEAALFLARRIA